MCVCVCVCVSFCSRHEDFPKADKGATSGFIVDPLLGIVVCEEVTLGAVACGGGVGALVWGVRFLGLGCVWVCFVGQKCGSKILHNPPPPDDPSPIQRKPPSNLATALVYVVSTVRATPPPPQAPKSPPEFPPVGPTNGEAPKVSMRTWGVSLCIMRFSFRLIFDSLILIPVG